MSLFDAFASLPGAGSSSLFIFDAPTSSAASGPGVRAVLAEAASGVSSAPRAKRRRCDDSPAAAPSDAAWSADMVPVAPPAAGAGGVVDGPPGADGSPASARTLYIGGVAPGVGAALLYELALQCGPVRHVRVPAGGGGFAFVEFEHEASRLWAARALSGLVLRGSPLRAAPRAVGVDEDGGAGGGGGGGGGSDGGVQLHLRPLPPGLDEWDLLDLGSLALDCVASVRLPRDAARGGRGYGFISFTRGAEARRIAVPALTAGLASVAGRAVTVSFADATAAALPEASGEEGGSGGGGGGAAPRLLFRDAGGDSLPIDETLLMGLRIEAITAHCRRIEERLRGEQAAEAGAAAAAAARATAAAAVAVTAASAPP